jgi:hypothetical protein
MTLRGIMEFMNIDATKMIISWQFIYGTPQEYPTLYWEYPPAFRVLEQCSRELHECEHWPKGI